MKYPARTVSLRLLTAAAFASLLLAPWPASHAGGPRASVAARRADGRAPAGAVVGEPGGRLLFTSDRDGNAEIYLKDGAAGPEVNLSKNAARDSTPVSSPDGTRIAFTSDRSGRSNIYVMNADGSNVRKITQNDGGVDFRVYDPAWSPDGRRIAYVGSFMGELSSLYVTNADGTGGSQRLGRFSEVADPAWSPDGTRLAVAARESFVNEDGRPLVRFGLYVLNADGSGETLVSRPVYGFDSFSFSPEEGSGPAWSPDGARLAFTSVRDGNPEIYTINATGGDLRRLTDNPARDSHPAWLAGAPGTARIAFTSDRSGRREVYAVDPATGETARLTEGAGGNFDPDWQAASPAAPPARAGRILFSVDFEHTNPRGNNDIHAVDPDGSNFVALTNTPDAIEYNPSWSPDGTRVAFLGILPTTSRSLFVMNADGTHVRRLAHSADPAQRPSWSPAGTRIAFIGGSDLAYTVRVINHDGTDERLLLPLDGTYFQAAWSPDGRRLAYVINRFAGFNEALIFVVNADGTGARLLTVGDNYERHPAWSPDGTKIAFIRNTPDSFAGSVHVVNADGPPAPVTPPIAGVSQALSPAWSPDGTELAFAATGPQGHGLYRVSASGGTPTLVHKPASGVIESVDWGGAPQPTVQWRADAFRAREGGGGDALVVTRLGDLTRPASVNFHTRDACGAAAPATCPGAASARADYAHTAGAINFAPGEASKTIAIPIIDDAHVEGDETFEIVLSEPAQSALGSQVVSRVTVADDDTAPSAVNPIDTARFFVRMHYLDFLGREPEPQGLEAWVRVWAQCPNLDNEPTCDRVTISSGFFRSREFHLRGLFVYNFYRVALGRPVTYPEFHPELARVFADTAAGLELRRAEFARNFAERSDFRAAYDGTTNAQFVDRLLRTAGVQSPGRDAWVDDLDRARKTRPQVLREIVESREVTDRHYNAAFVTMQYFGYLKRDPEEEGFNKWLAYLNANPADFRTMIHGFVRSREYRSRFGRP